jgi:uncharacterized protein YhbP (UPF0306 family)
LYQEAVTLCKSSNEEKWKKAVFWVFDAPNSQFLHFEERIQYLKELKLPSFVKVVAMVKCTGMQEFETLLKI